MCNDCQEKLKTRTDEDIQAEYEFVQYAKPYIVTGVRLAMVEDLGTSLLADIVHHAQQHDTPLAELLKLSDDELLSYGHAWSEMQAEFKRRGLTDDKPRFFGER